MAKRVDANQVQIVQLFRSLGCSVKPLHMVGDGFPDLAVGCSGVNLLVEVKDGSKPPSARKLTTDEQKWHDGWRGQRCIVETEDDVIKLVNNTRVKKR